ncbi:hypothetical protein SAMN05661091_2201 [Paenibacillus uliginis N3/975]|uniref:DUF2087 domain-containing protein n=1 Tax=Paenibacillus uliginis N3/975 TaxID=1313296 RepID=A0A1X7HA50_9BACL|nr:DUF2087 domain-containing protein [Paenibacillus uliginis]SMF82617.1 hypothetical protein SAMN05661091_2201 [Paenibacillus uliginis N3/975]
MELQDRFWNATIEELKQGFFEEDHGWVCLLCGREIEKGLIYPDDGLLYEPKRYIALHVEREHGSVFQYLTGLDKKLTGLTDHQSRLLQLFYQGKSDAEVQMETGIGSASTIRNHRFALKEKERQAKVLLTLMELLKEKDAHAPSFVPLHKSAKMVDERYNVTEEERVEILTKLFPSGTDGKLTKFKLKEKQRYVVLREIATRFQPEKTYTETEVNEILKGVYDDYVTVRRFLIEYGFIDREPDGSKYWLIS